MPDITKWALNEILEDYRDHPIHEVLTTISDKYDIHITIQTKKKEA